MKKIYILVGILAVIALALFLVFKPSVSSYPILDDVESVDFYRSEICGCCGLYKGYLERNGKLNVNDVMAEDTDKIKKQFNIPAEMESCHTTIINGYFVEGHMPLEAVEKLLEERPDILGIALPGMPQGSPGMTGSKEDFVIYAIHKDGTKSEFMRM